MSKKKGVASSSNGRDSAAQRLGVKVFDGTAVTAGSNDLFIAGDAHQRIYDYRVSLSSLGIETRGRRLEEIESALAGPRAG